MGLVHRYRTKTMNNSDRTTTRFSGKMKVCNHLPKWKYHDCYLYRWMCALILFVGNCGISGINSSVLYITSASSPLHYFQGNVQNVGVYPNASHRRMYAQNGDFRCQGVGWLEAKSGQRLLVLKWCSYDEFTILTLHWSFSWSLQYICLFDLCLPVCKSIVSAIY
jgi:hypothetical protein